MKKFLYLLLMPLLVLASCEKPEPEPEPVVGKITLLSDDTFVFSDDGESHQVAFEATLDWEASASAEFVTLEPKSGQAGEAAVTIKIGENTEYEERTATVTITCGEDSKTINLTQKHKGALLLTESTLNVAAEGGMVTIVSKTTSNVTYAIDSQCAEWVKEPGKAGLTEYNFDFMVMPNESEQPRTGKIVFTNEENKTETITIQQAGVYVEPEVTANVKGKVTCNGVGLADVLVSDGVEIVKTDAEGNYQLHSDKHWRYVFVINPAGYDFPLDGILPANYKLLSQNAETEEEVNFELEKTQEDNYTLLVLGDMHLANWSRVSDVQQFNAIATDINNTINETPGKKYVLTLGDMTYEQLWLSCGYAFPEYLKTMNSSFTDLPFFHTMGNHDNEMEVGGDFEKALKYTQNLAPNYYSFNIGKVHYIVLDNIDYTGVGAGNDERPKYKEQFTAEQFEWIKKDLAFVDKSTPIIVAAHSMLSLPSGTGWIGEMPDLNTFIGLFDGYNVRYLSGHTHNFFYRAYNPNFVEYNSGSLCGSWWYSGLYHPGLYLAQDGTPGGYTVWNVNGTECTHYYKAACHPADHQFHAYDMNEVKKVVTADKATNSSYTKYVNQVQAYADNTILLNIWGHCDDWTIEVTENGSPLTVEHISAYDPLHIAGVSIPAYNKYSNPDHLTDTWRHFFKATASSADSDVTIKVTDSYGKVYTETMERPCVFDVEDFIGEIATSKPKVEVKHTSSSSLVFNWTIGLSAAEDAAVPYKLALYKDAACTQLAHSFETPASLSVWGGRELSFAFGGLEPGTTYYFVVTNLDNGDESNVIEARTKDFTHVDATKVTNATAGTVLLAEDFGRIGWGNDQIAGAIGYVPDGRPLGSLTGHHTDDNGTYQAYDKVTARLFGDMVVSSDEALYDWGFYGNSTVYALNGALRVCTSQTARTHVVTPALSGIPEGETATIDVTVTSAAYESGTDVAVFVNDYNSLTRSVLPDNKAHSKFSSQGGKFTGASLTNGHPLNVNVKEWTTKTVRISGVDRNSCLLIGSYEDRGTKNRFFLDDVVVTLVAFGEVEEPETPETPAVESIDAECIATSSSTLIFSWLENDDVDATVSNAFTATLYKDEACTVVDQSFDIPKACEVWKGNTPKYVFGGLQPSTDYWFKVYDTTNNLVSPAIKATTDAFTHVLLPSEITSTGVVLAEDFGEIRWDFDHLTSAVGFRPASKSNFASTEVKTSENNSSSYIYDGYHYNGGGEIAFSSCGDAINNSRLKGWSVDTKAYIHPGYIKLGETKNRGWVLTPAFPVPEGKKLIVNVTVTAARHNNSQSNNWCVVVLNEELAKFEKDGAHTSSFDWPDIEDATLYQEFTINGTDWETHTISGLEVCSGDRVCFGGKRYHDGTEGGDLKGRAYISDMVVEVVEIVNE